MAERSIHQILADAEHQIDAYKHPDTDEAKAVLNGIIKAAGLGDISHDDLTYLSLSKGMVRLTTEYSTRGCTQSGDFEFPQALLYAADPIRAATEWGLRRKLSSATTKRDEMKLALARMDDAVKQASEALDAHLLSASGGGNER